MINLFLDVLVCSIAVYFEVLCSILTMTGPLGESEYKWRLLFINATGKTSFFEIAPYTKYL